MAKRLSHKERGFVNDVADGIVPTQAALKNYDTEDYSTASNIASVNLDKPKIINALKELGFDSDNAKRVVGQILNDDSVEEQHRLKAASLIFDVNGDKAPEKVIYLNIEPKPNDAIRELAHGLLNRQRE